MLFIYLCIEDLLNHQFNMQNKKQTKKGMKQNPIWINNLFEQL